MDVILVAGFIIGGSWVSFKRVPKLLVTFAHEAGHAISALLAGGTVEKIKIEKNTSGITRSATPKVFWRTRQSFIAYSGYTAPPLFALPLAFGYNIDPQVTTTATAVLTLFVTILWIRNMFGVLVGSVIVLANIGGSFTGITAQMILAAQLGILVIGGISSSMRQPAHQNESDAGVLKKITKIPAGVHKRTMVFSCIVSGVLVALILVSQFNISVELPNWIETRMNQ